MDTKDQGDEAVRVRRATVEDAAVVAQLFDAYRQFYACAPDPALARAFIGARLARGDAVILLAEGGPEARARPLGFCQLYPSFCSLEAAPIACLYDLFVAPDARRGGVGRRLLHAAAAQARHEGWCRLDLSTARSNHAAQALYRALGWVRDDVFDTYSLRVAP